MLFAAFCFLAVVRAVHFFGESSTTDAAGPIGNTEISPLEPYEGTRALADVLFVDGEGKATALSAFRGRVVLLNIWATWCGPCIAEMPALDRAQARLGGADFEVVALSIDRAGLSAVRDFYRKMKLRSLGVYHDANGTAQEALRVIAIPTTILIDREGREVLRQLGPQDWDSEALARVVRNQKSK